MPVITRALIRKRAEHNEGIISTLEELTLHQEELENINEVLGGTCRKLKILYLQNNIIGKMENLVHLKDLVYLNLALNNVSKIEGLQNCEFLSKLDLTINFVDVDTLEESIDHLTSRTNLVDLYMMGNPAQANWPGFNSYVIAKLPQLKTLDGTDITRSMQIQARQKLPQLEAELRKLAAAMRSEKALKRALAGEAEVAEEKSSGPTNPAPELLDCDEEVVREEEEDDHNKMTENTPEVRQEIYRELAEQKKEKADREKAQQPKERDYAKEQEASVEETRKREAEMELAEIKQKNEGGWEFRWEEEARRSDIALEVFVPRHLDSSLIDVDVHPHYISIIIKSKVLRLRLPVEVRAGESRCQRSKTTGSLMVTMPKVNPRETGLFARREDEAPVTVFKPVAATGSRAPAGAAGASRTVLKPKKLSLHEQMVADALASSAAAAAAGAGAGGTDGGAAQAVQKLELGGAAPLTSTLSNIVRKPRSKADEDTTTTFTLDNVEPAQRGSSAVIQEL